uniref:NADH-ubiquinone oxidoreductase chain 3 n=1 Tax=Dollfustrema vaneyi TaxID=438518 RepID=A0AAU7N3P2_9TREM
MFLSLIGVIIFLFLLLLISFYHTSLWNYDWLSLNCVNPRCWVSTFECGFCSGRSNESYFSYTYFILLVFFVVFDLEISLLLNLPYEFCLYKNVFYFLLFLFALCVGYGAEVYSGYVRWGY